MRRVRGIGVMFTPPVAYKGIVIVCKRNTLQLGEKITVHSNSMPAAICLRIVVTTKTSWMRLWKDTISILFSDQFVLLLRGILRTVDALFALLVC